MKKNAAPIIDDEARQEPRTFVTGSADRLGDDELELLIWALSLDMKGDLGLRSNAGVLAQSGNVEAIKRPSELRCGPIYVKTPTHEKGAHEISDRMLAAAGMERQARAVLNAIGPHRETLWRCYVAKFPGGLRQSLAAFADLGPLAPDTKAAAKASKEHQNAAGQKHRRASPNESESQRESREAHERLAYCQGLSTRVVQHGADTDEADRLAIQTICDEAEPMLAAACRAVKSALRKLREQKRDAANRKANARNE